MATEEELEKILAGDVGDKLKKLQNACQEKLGIEPEQVISTYNKELTRLKSVLADLSEEQLARRAYVTVSGLFKRDLRSPAKFFEGIVIGAGPIFNMVGQAREEALALWQTDREKAIKEGFTDAEGRPLDRREQFASGRKNPEFGKPLPEERNIQNAVGVAAPKGGDIKFFRLVLGENLAGKVKIPLNTPVMFRANIPDTQEDPNMYRLNPYAHIEFQETENPEIPPAEEIYESEYLEKYRVPLGELPDFHKIHGRDPQRFLATVGDVAFIDEAPNPTTGSLRIVLDDETLPEEHDGFAAWVTPHLQGMIDFDMGSRIYACGSSASTEFRDRGEVWMINLFGFFAIPRFKIPKGEAPRGILGKDTEQVS